MYDLIGQKFGRLTVIAFDGVKNRKAWWKCTCDCGLSVLVNTGNLRSGNTKSCGCFRREITKARGKSNTIHGEGHGNKTRLYSIWCGMRQRCNNKNNDGYKWYGKKGVRICSEWESYPEFKSWAENNGYADNLSIDRINHNGNYEPGNCRWITLSENVARANKNHTTRKVIRGEGIRERVPAATHSSRARTAISYHEAEALKKSEKIC